MQKKNIVEDLDNGKYTSTTVISDAEFDRINAKLDQYNLVVSSFHVSSSLTPEQQALLQEKIAKLEIAINELNA